MQILKDILTKLNVSETIGEHTKRIEGIVFDSRKVVKDSLFVAIRGTQADGHRFIDKAIESGANTIVCEALPSHFETTVTYLKVPDSAEALGLLSANFYGHPSGKMKLVGITGTNGKTTTASLLYELFTELGYKTGLLSTVENRIGKQIMPATHTTPDAVSLNALLKEMYDAACDFVFMEVSSHAIDQRRIAGLTFAGGVFTNMSHDHLDYHKTFKAYIFAKKRFFDELPATAFALSNKDDKRGTVMVQNTAAAIHYYSLQSLTDFKAKILDNSLNGLHLEIDGQEFFGRLIGTFNAYNTLAVYATAILLGMEKTETLVALSRLKAAAGRFDYLIEPQRKIIGIVDYAHTPDALEKVLTTIDKLRKGTERILTVVGCGGDRDRTKRPIMAAVACQYSDQIIITSDNPRTENPLTIMEEMEKGIPGDAQAKVLSIADRLQAIRTACRLAKDGDIILVAGKGHENYQEINGVRHSFDDKEILKQELMS